MQVNKLVLFLVALGFASVLYGRPAKPGFKEVKQSDGTVLSVAKTGDENYHFFITTDGQTVERNGAGDYVYVPHYFEKEDLMSGMIAHNPEVRTGLERSFIETLSTRNVLTKRTQAVEKMAPRSATVAACRRSVIILAQFKDKKFSSEDPKKIYEEQFNGESGSAKQYFTDNSSGAFVPEFVIAGPVTLSNDYAYYGANTGDRQDVRSREMIREACRLADDEIDYSLLSLDEFGYVGSVYVIYAGEGEASSDDENTIWPHAWALSSPLSVDGVFISSYACSNEIEEGGLGGIGAFCHEFSHVLGLPDFYDTDYAGSGGSAYHPYFWSVMASGNYNGERGSVPCAYTAIEREMLGWGHALVLEEPGTYELEHTAVSGRFYRINTLVDTEYFLMENRQLESWDREIPYHGMLIFHIDKSDQYVWSFNQVNCNPAHQYADIEEADDRRVVYTGYNYAAFMNSLKGDPFPGLSGNTSFTDDTEPSSLTWNGQRTEKPVTNITEENGIIRFRFMGGGPLPEAPVAREAEAVGATCFTAVWDPVEEADGYELYVYTITGTGEGNLVEHFDDYPSEEEGWEHNITALYLSSPFFGESVPALKFSNPGSFIKTPEVAGPIGKFSFCVVAAGNTTGSTIKIEGWNGASWVVIDDMDVSMTDRTKRIVTYDKTGSPAIPDHITALRFTYNKVTGNLAFDDLNIEWGADDRQYVEGYGPKSLDKVYSQEVTGLIPDTRYYYELSAVSVEGRSALSNRIEVKTQSGNGIENDTDRELRVSSAGDGLYVYADRSGLKADIYDLSGRLVMSVGLDRGNNNIPLDGERFYLVRIAGKVWKIVK